MYQKLSQIEIPVEIYAPFGTISEKLSSDFLSSGRLNRRTMGTVMSNINTPGNMAALEVLSRLEKQRYAKPVGRTMIQKIYYVLTELSVDTGLSFTKSSYGPFSSGLRQILTAFANQNLISESQYDTMMVQNVGSEYIAKRGDLLKDLAQFEPQISKTVDLFSRIKNTDQAEEVTTILFSVKELKRNSKNVTEDDLFQYIIGWKKTWKDQSKKSSVSETMRNLEALGWIKLAHGRTEESQSLGA